MITFTLDPVPTLLHDGEVIRGIGILQRLHQLSPNNTEAAKLFQEAASAYCRVSVPKIGFRLEHASAVMPTKRIIDVGYDLTIVKALHQTTPLTTLYETYVSLDIPFGFYVELVPRSSISKIGYVLTNSVGIIDPGYTATVKVPLMKVDPDAEELTLPLRIAQLIIKPNVVSEAFDATEHDRIENDRGSGGFGSTD
jgi:dUTP pyrophosphatase